jgi:hypothetical protein
LWAVDTIEWWSGELVVLDAERLIRWIQMDPLGTG